MKLFPILLIPILFLSGCSLQPWRDLEKTDTSDKSGLQILEYKKPCMPGMYVSENGGCSNYPKDCPAGQTLTGFPGTEFCEISITGSKLSEIPFSISSNLKTSPAIGSGLLLTSMGDELILTYSGRTINKWEILNPEEATLESCSSFVEELTEEKTWDYYKLKWKNLALEEKRKCLRTNLKESISVEQIGIGGYYTITQTFWEGQKIWIFDSKSQNIQEMESMTFLSDIQQKGKYIFVILEEGQSIGLQHLLIYDKDLSRKIAEWPVSDGDSQIYSDEFMIDDVELIGDKSIKIYAHDFGEPGIPNTNKKTEHIINLP